MTGKVIHAMPLYVALAYAVFVISVIVCVAYEEIKERKQKQ